MYKMFMYAGRSASSFIISGLSHFNTNKVQNMEYVFSYSGENATTWNVGDLSNWNVSKVTSMKSMFDGAAKSATEVNIGDLSNWDTSNVTNMFAMFYYFGKVATTFNSIGHFKIYATDLLSMFWWATAFKGEITIYNLPTRYDTMFYAASMYNGGYIKVNYTSNVTNIDELIATKYSSSNVIKGDLVN